MGLGVDMEGLMALSWVSLDAWSRQTQAEPEPRDVDALFMIDRAFRNPDPKKKPNGD